MEKIAITKAGYARMEAELKQLRTVERPAIIQAISEARAHGDLKENAEYHAAKEKQGFIEGRIQDLEARISRADVIDVATLSGERITFGATVTLIDEDTEEEVTYAIVSEYEADLNKRRISLTAPIARALIGKEEGDSVEVRTPKGERCYEILSVAFMELVD